MATKKTNKNVNASANATKVVCPVCGTSFEIPEHEQHVCGTAIAKDSGLGTVYLKPEGMPSQKCEGNAQAGGGNTQAGAGNARANSADIRIQKMKAAGIDVSKYFSITNASGEGVIMKWQNGIPVAVTDDELSQFGEIEKTIYANGYVKNTSLFRRWVMAQYLRAENNHGGLVGYMKNLGYEYSIKMLLEELRVQTRLYASDMSAFNNRNRFFNRYVATDVIRHHQKMVEKYIDGLQQHKCKGVPYKKVAGRNIFCADIYSKVIQPIYKHLADVSSTRTPLELYSAFKKFADNHIKLSWQTSQCPEWKDAFKAAGAYYTLQNLIKFHGVRINGLDLYASLEALEKKTTECINECCGFALHGFAREVIKESGFKWGK